MIRRANLHLLLPTAVICGVMVTPAASRASAQPGNPGSSSGGAGVSGSGSSAGPPSSSPPNPLVQPENGTVSASGDGITVSTLQSGLLTRQVRFSGTAPAADAGETVEIEWSTPTAGSTWEPAAQGTVGPDGAFSVIWRASRSGRLGFKAVVLASSSAAAASASDGSGSQSGSGASSTASGGAGPESPAVAITVYRPSLATFYGPGFFGRRTACGETLRARTRGVASRRLACGTRVSILYRGRAIVVPVIDRGPFANHAQWDLTQATAKALGMTGTGGIGTLAVS